ncbi:MAG: triose-phosphate isomerase [Candidatus Eisenbacteria bacterium]
MSTLWIAGNWKMNKTRAEARGLIESIAGAAGDLPPGRRLLVFPSFPSIATVAELAGDRVEVGGQNFHPGREGAFTGEVSARQLLDAGASWVLIGHSERRHLFGEGDASLAAKLRSALDQGLRPLFCIGETLAEREGGETEAVLARQLRLGLALVESTERARVVVAYEPVWAIGTGRTATPDQAQSAHAFARGELAAAWGGAGRAVPLLYGGSVTPATAADLLRQTDVDGVLVGGASLDAASFLAIARAET